MTELKNEIVGLGYQPEFISLEEEQQLVALLDAQPWLNDLKRRTQHYGYKYDYTKKKIDRSMYLGAIPDFFKEIVTKLQPIFEDTPDQIIVNEYQPGQGIAPHVDCIPCFGPIVISLSLLAPCIMEFSHLQQSQIWLEPRSLLTLQGEARYLWKHGIPARLEDQENGNSIPRQRRVSITFRTIQS